MRDKDRGELQTARLESGQNRGGIAGIHDRDMIPVAGTVDQPDVIVLKGRNCGDFKHSGISYRRAGRAGQHNLVLIMASDCAGLWDRGHIFTRPGRCDPDRSGGILPGL